MFEATARISSSALPARTQIAMGVLQALLNALDFDMTMVEAVSAPRFSATSNAIDVSNRIPRGVQRELEARGYEVVRSPETYGFAAVHAIRVHPGRARRRRGPRARRHRDGGVRRRDVRGRDALPRPGRP